LPTIRSLPLGERIILQAHDLRNCAIENLTMPNIIRRTAQAHVEKENAEPAAPSRSAG